MASVNQNRSARTRLILALALLALCTAAVYAGSLHAPFVLDDNWNIADNPSIRSLWPPWQALAGHPDTGVAGRPLVNLSLAVNHALFKMNPAGYRAFNIAVHAGCGMLLFLLLRLVVAGPGGMAKPGPEPDWACFFAALCFLLHPMQTQAVTYVTQRLESMMAFFYLACCLSALYGLQKGKKAPKALAVVLFFLGATSKEAVITAPLAIFAYDATFLTKSPGRAFRSSPGLYTGLALGMAALLLLTATGRTARWAISQGPGFSPLTYALLQPQVIWHYIIQFFWPLRLLFDYGWPQDALFGWPGWHPFAIAFSTVGLMGLIALALRGLFLRRLPAYAAFFYLLVLAPTSSVVPLFCVAAQQRPYLANAALCGLVFAGGFHLIRRLAMRLPEGSAPRRAALPAAACLAGAICLVLGGLTIARNRDFKSALALWKDSTEKAPWNSRAQAAYGQALEQAGMMPEAMLRYELAIYLNPRDYVASNNLGFRYASRGQTMRARSLYARALAESPGYAPALINMAAALLAEGRPAEALDYAKKGAAAKPYDAQARNTLGAALAASGQTREAVNEFTRAIEQDGNLASALANRGFAQLNMGKFALAGIDAEKALALEPDLALARKTAGIASLALGNPEKAREHLLQAARLAPGDASIFYNLGVADLKQGNRAGAADNLRRALAINPSYAKAAQVLQALGASLPGGE